MEKLDKLLDHLCTGYSKIEELGKQNHLILTLGVTGSGKSTFVLHVADYDDQLTSKELVQDSGEFVIEDDHGRISDAESTICSQTFFPEIIKGRDSSTSMIYCDCPGFEDTRSPIVDMANAYFIQKILKASIAVKFVFVVSYSSLRVGVNRTDLKTLVEHATALIKNLDKMKNSVCLAVTKVDNTYLKNGTLVSDEVVKANVAGFLEKAITSAQQMDGQWDENFCMKFQQFLSIFISKDKKGDYSRICIFRRPDEPGRLSKIPFIAQRKPAIMKTLAENVVFQVCKPSDFGLSIKHESQNELYQFLEIIQESFLSILSTICYLIFTELHDFVRTSFDIDEILGYIDKCRHVLEVVTNDLQGDINPHQFIKKLEEVAARLEVKTVLNTFEKLRKLVDYFDTLIPLSKQKVSYKTLEWCKVLQDTIFDYRNARLLYEFFRTLLTDLMKYDVQCGLQIFNERAVKNILEHLPTSSVGKVMKFLFQAGVQVDTPFDNIRKLKLSDVDVHVLKEILELSLMSDYVADKEDRIITVFGNIVKLSDISHLLGSKTKGVQVFAKTIVYIDIDLDLKGHGAEVFIISPIWEIVGARKVILDGRDGKSMKKADDGEWDGANGADGNPGRPGGSGGHFYGIAGKILSENSLTITSNGGDGGPGQDGGKGARGRDGESGRSGSSSNTVSRDVLDFFVYTQTEVCSSYAGEKGGTGGNGGDGGVGGLGGMPGTIVIKKMESSANAVTQAMAGKEGAPGKGGKGGKGGRDGDYYRGTRKTYHIFKFEVSSDSEGGEYCKSDTYGMHGDNGDNGFNMDMLEPPVPIERTEPSEIISRYLDFHNECNPLDIQKRSVEKFINYVLQCSS